MPSFEDQAVRALHAVLASSQFTDALRAEEVDASISTNSLTDPADVVRAFMPFDNRSPLVQIFDEGGEFVDQLERLYSVDCVVAVSFAGTTDMEASEDFMRRYTSALRRTIVDNPLLRPTLPDGAAQVVGALVQNHDRAVFGDDSQIRHHRAIGVEVRVHSP